VSPRGQQRLVRTVVGTFFTYRLALLNFLLGWFYRHKQPPLTPDTFAPRPFFFSGTGLLAVLSYHATHIRLAFSWELVRFTSFFPRRAFGLPTAMFLSKRPLPGELF